MHIAMSRVAEHRIAIARTTAKARRPIHTCEPCLTIENAMASWPGRTGSLTMRRRLLRELPGTRLEIGLRKSLPALGSPQGEQSGCKI